MFIEDTVEGIRTFFRLLTAFAVEQACVVHVLAGSNRPPSCIVEPLLQGFALFRHFGVGDGRFSVTMIDINGLITNDKFCLSRITHLHLGYCRLPDDRKQVLASLSSYPGGKEISSPQGGLHEPPVEDQTLPRPPSRC